MLVQIKPSVTNPTIADLYQNIESGKLILKPDFQRKFVWTQDHQEEFIDFSTKKTKAKANVSSKEIN